MIARQYWKSVFASILLFEMTVVNCIECQQGYEVTTTSSLVSGLRSITTGNCTEWTTSNPVCFRIESTASISYNGFTISGEAMYSGCHPRINCTEQTCGQYKKLILQELQASSVGSSISDIDITTCSVGCCNTNKCNEDNINMMDLLGPVVLTTTALETTDASKFSTGGTFSVAEDASKTPISTPTAGQEQTTSGTYIISSSFVPYILALLCSIC
ncbi:uncharacterized protein LOC144420953 isoform X2 [Styela clava]